MRAMQSDESIEPASVQHLYTGVTGELSDASERAVITGRGKLQKALQSTAIERAAAKPESSARWCEERLCVNLFRDLCSVDNTVSVHASFSLV